MCVSGGLLTVLTLDNIHINAHLRCSDAQGNTRDQISNLEYDSYSAPTLSTDWTVPKAALDAASYDVTYGLQTGSIGIGEPAPNFSGDAVIDNEITE
jgi:hypothetical protein